MVRMTGGEAIVKSLIEHGIDTVFGIPGAQVYGLFDALHAHSDDIRVIGARHEQATAYMAFGYSRSTGRPSAYAVVPGPGVLNTTAALCTAFGCNAPVLCLTGQVPSPFIGKGFGHLHELPDQLATLKSLTQWAERMASPERASEIIADAFRFMRSGKPGPACVEMPWDVFGQQGEVDIAAPLPLEAVPDPDPDEVSRAADLIAQAKRPMIAVGGGALDAFAQVRRFARRLNAPVIAFRSGRGIMPEDDPLFANIVAAWDVWDDCDLVIGIGTRLELTHLRWPYRPDGQKLVRIDIDQNALDRLPLDAGLATDSAVGVDALLAALENQDIKCEPQQEAIAASTARSRLLIEKVTPQVPYLEAIRSVMPREGIFVEELCQAGYASLYGYPVYQPRTYISPGYQGTLGFGFNTALGVKAANPDQPVVSISGDGGFMFGVQELATAVQYNLPVTAVVFDNGAYGNVRRDQVNSYDGRTIASELKNPDFVALAESFGVHALRAESPDQLMAALEVSLGGGFPSLIHIPVDRSLESNPWPLMHPEKPKIVP